MLFWLSAHHCLSCENIFSLFSPVVHCLWALGEDDVEYRNTAMWGLIYQILSRRLVPCKHLICGLCWCLWLCLLSSTVETHISSLFADVRCLFIINMFFHLTVRKLKRMLELLVMLIFVLISLSLKYLCLNNHLASEITQHKHHVWN